MLVMDYLLFAYPSANQVSTGRTQLVHKSFSYTAIPHYSRYTAAPQAWMGLDGKMLTLQEAGGAL